eukprot:TRINITY_DN41689_c5_g1_i1.p1 TRINITY_DN41689_c5_g1~~TRINITY_DN41689_c5_g1_i1.p1  ORF type:complete len:667 (+),score=154.96 TRINITY_DN41689_c5_g1_i1:392-2392(+)
MLLPSCFCREAEAAPHLAAGRCSASQRHGGKVQDRASATSWSAKSVTKLISSCGRQAKWASALQALEEVGRRGLQGDVVLCSAGVSVQSKCRRWRAAGELLKAAASTTLETDTVCHSAVLGGLDDDNVGGWRLMLDILGCLASSSLCCNVNMLNAAIGLVEKCSTARSSGFSRAGAGPCRAWRVVGSMLLCAAQQRLAFDALTCTAAMGAVAPAGSAGSALDQWLVALEVFGGVTRSGIRRQIQCYGAAVAACEKEGSWRAAAALLAALGEDGLKGDVIASSAAASASAKGHHWESAIQTLRGLVGGNLEANVITLNAVLNSQQLQDLWISALELVDAMSAKALCPDTITVGALLTSLACSATRPRWEAAMCLVRWASSADIELGVIVHGAAIDGAAKSVGQWSVASAALRSLPQKGIQATSACCNALISGFGESRQWEQATALAGEVLTWDRLPELTTFNAAIAACERGQRWRKAAIFLHGLQLRALAADTVTYSSLISTCEKCLQWHVALALLDEMMDVTIPPNELSYNAAMCACEKGLLWEQALQLLLRLQGAKQIADTINYNAVITACEKALQWEAALDVFTSMEAHVVEPSVITFTATVTACRRASRWKEALQLLRGMELDGMQPDVMTRSAAAEACAIAQVHVATQELLAELPEAVSILQ